MSISSTLKGIVARVIGKRAELEAIEPLSPRLVRLRMRSEALLGRSLVAGEKVKIEVRGGLLRSYTPSSIDPERGAMEVVVYLHGESPACDWARALRPGAIITFVGPAASVTGPPPALSWAAFFGDETTIGLAEAIEGALPAGTPFFGAIEVRSEDREALAGSPLLALPRGEARGQALLEHLAALQLPREGGTGGEGRVWLSGEASAVLALRAALLERGLRRAQLHIKPYWSLKGKAERKRLERLMGGEA